MGNVVFDEPPVQATTLSVRFEQSSHIMSSHLARLHADWMQDLPIVEERPPDLDEAPASAGLGDSPVWPLPATTFTSTDGSESVTLQEGLLKIRWERGEGDYPGFSNLAGRLAKHYEELSRALTHSGISLRPRSSKCLYRNEIKETDGPSLAVGVLTGWTGHPRNDLPIKGYVGVRIHACAHPENHSCSSYVMVDADAGEAPELTISVSRRLSEDEDSPLGGLHEAHAELVELFLRFTNDDQQRGWKRR